MPDWKSYVREHLHLAKLRHERVDEIVEDLAVQLEEHYREALSRGASQEEAAKYARDQIRDWEGFKGDLIHSNRSSVQARSERWYLEAESSALNPDAGRSRFSALFADLLYDLLYGFRILKKHPGFTVIALITLGLGIGINTALFSLFDAWQRLPDRLAEPESLAFLWYRSPRYQRSLIRLRDYLAIREEAGSFTQMGVFDSGSSILSGAGEPERVNAVKVSASLWPMLGFDARAGRIHKEEEDSSAKSGVAILSDSYWQRKFNGDPDVLGKTVLLDDESHTIIGIMPPEVDLEEMWHPADLFIPLPLDTARIEGENQDFGLALVRLKPDVTFKQAAAELDLISARLAQDYPETNRELEIWIQPLTEKFLSRDDRMLMSIFLVAVAAVLLIACVNVANMLLAKASSRTREFAVRIALGARRSRLIRQLLAESLMLAFAGGLLGILMALWAVDLFVASVEFAPFLESELRLNLTVLAYTFLVSLLAALVFGMAPIFVTSRISPSETLKNSAQAASTGPSQNRLRHALIIGQLAIGLPMIICSGLALRHVQSLKSADSLGFNPDRLLTFNVELPRYRYADDSQRGNFYREMLQNIEAMPGIVSAGAVSSLPIGTTSRLSGKITIDGQSEPEEDFYGYHVVSEGYFETMGVQLLGGRFFAWRDNALGPPVAIMNQRAAMRYWPEGDAVGKRIKLDGPAYAPNWVTIIGVVADFGCDVFGEPFPPALYVPLGQNPYASMNVVARTQSEPGNAMESMRKTIHGMDPGIPINDLSAAREVVHRWLRDDRWLAYFLGGMAVLVLSLASIGLYGIMSYTVAQRTSEIGVRLALGAERRDILGFVIKRCLRLATIGTLIGILLSIPIGMLMASSLRGVTGLDPLTYVGVILLLIAVALAAGYLPARKASKIDPILTLRYE